MKAYVLHGIGDLRYEDVTVPECPSGWAVVQVRAAGICSSDIPRIYRKGTYHFPSVPGHEFSGVVVQTGDRADEDWTGKRVGVFPLIPCGKCPQCAAGRYEMCENYDYLGSRRDGGFAEQVLVPVWNLIELPERISFSAGAMLEPVSVAVHAVKQAGDLRGKSASVVGTGMIGITAARWAVIRGASRVRVIGRNRAKRLLAEQQEGLIYCGSMQEAEAEKSQVVIEAAGTPDSISAALELAAPGGSVVLMGNPSGDILLGQDIYWKILRRQLRIRGTWNSSYNGAGPSDWTESLQAMESGTLNVENLISHRFFQEELERGLRLMAEHRESYCKVMTVWNEY